MKLKTIFVLAIFSLSLGILFVPNDADARRMGGGRSFGSSSRMLNTAPKPNVTAPTTMQRQSTQQNNVTATGAGAVGATRSRGMMGGMFGGLLAGSLIGSMLMGGGFAGGSLFDIILIGGLLFLGYKLFFRRRPQQMQSTAGQNTARQNTVGQQDLQNNIAPSVQNFQLRTPTTRTDIGTTKTETDEFYAEHFDKAEFLRGAKILYVRLQEAWDKRDLDDIAVFSTEAVMKELRKQKEEDPSPSQTEIIVVNAYLQAIDRDGIFERAAVHFNVRLREDPSSQKTEEVDEIWHFIRNADAKDSWKLDGIQQTQ